MNLIKTNDEAFNIYYIDSRQIGQPFTFWFIKDWGESYSRVGVSIGDCGINNASAYPDAAIAEQHKIIEDLVNEVNFIVEDSKEMESVIKRFMDTLNTLLGDHYQAFEEPAIH